MKSLLDRLPWVKEDFDRIAVEEMLGNPEGKPAFGYVRVSSSGQAEEGRGGFPRQLQHVHQKAQELNLAITWARVYFDDHTGFEFRGRPSLTKLRDLLRAPSRPADDLVIENIDRLSREATWHQGYLLDELEQQLKVRVHFWKELGTKLERVVYGTVSQDRMLTDLERMAAGNMHKAESGRVTARTAAFGYRFVNSLGGEEKARKDTHYAFLEPQATILRMIYQWLVEERVTLGEISRRLMDRNIKTPNNGHVWDPTLLRALVKNTVYKGEYFAHRYTHVKRISNISGKEVTHKIERPRNEWIYVPVPPLVSPEVWDEAQKVMRENRTLSLRNTKREYLLVNLLYCADCATARMTIGGRYVHKTTKQGPQSYEAMYYRCTNRTRPKHIVEALGYDCSMPQIASHRLDDLVWSAVINILLDRERLDQGIERYFSRQRVETTREEIVFVQTQITELDLEDELLYQAYLARAFDADEYAQKRFALKERKQQLEDTKEQLQKRLGQQASRQEQKQMILASVDELKQQADQQLPYDLRRKVILKVVDKITVNTREQWFELEGSISGKFDFTPVDTDSWRRPA